MGLQLFKETTSIDFMGMRNIAYAISAAFIILSLGAVIYHGGLRYGVDFAGGVAVQLQFEQTIGDEEVKAAIGTLNLPGLAIQEYGDTGKDFFIRFSSAGSNSQSLRPELLAQLETALPDNKATIMRLEMVGPKVGEDLRNAALQAIYFAVLLITVYISGRFEHRWMIAAIMTAALGSGMYLMGLAGLDMGMRVLGALTLTTVICWYLKLNFALGAIMSLLHDVLITIGMLTILNIEFDLTIIAALLTLVGYSLNDTIIVYDRIRENLQGQNINKPDPFDTILNVAINQTLNRTVLTSLTTLVAAFSLLILGGGVIHNFAITVVIGIVVGTFSSSFVATPILLLFGNTAQYLASIQPDPEDTERPGEHGMV